jgi:hypothetical protein
MVGIVLRAEAAASAGILPDGVTYTADGFGTAVTNSFFNVFQMFSVEKATLASPTGFEPVLPP